MAITISEIKNLTNGKSVEATAKLKSFDNQTAYVPKIVNTKGTLADWSDFDEEDNIQVVWKDGNKVIETTVGGTIKKEGTEAGKVKITINGLMKMPGLSLDLRGQIAIGPKNPKPGQPEAALVSVRMGNTKTDKNLKGDKFIDFSDKTDGAPGSYIRLDQLVAWIKEETESTATVTYPELKDANDAEVPDVQEFLIEFKEFHFNIDQKTFDFNVQSRKDDEFKFGNFTIKNVGFRISNEPVALSVVETKEAETE
ncbi:hypothetical protein [Pontimicrobium sp. MEBiC01747]